MTPVVFVLLAVAGGLGASCRLLVDGLVRSRIVARMPWGTVIVNVTGSLLLGYLAGLGLGGTVPESVQLIVGAGFLGGYTTFSTASIETVRLIQDRHYTAGLFAGLGMLLAALLASAVGLWLGQLA